MYKCVECYNVKTDSWSRVRDMNVGRRGAAVVVGNDYFYLPPSDNISSFPLCNMEILTIIFPCAH